MNGKRPLDPDYDSDPDEGLDPALTGLFTAANEPLPGAEEFVSSILKDIQRARRRRLLSQASGTLMALAAGAFAAPYVGEQTFVAVDWLSRNLATTPETLASPAAYLLATFITWRIMRRAFR